MLSAERHELVREGDGPWVCQAEGCPFADEDDREAVAHAVAHQEEE